MESKEDEAQRDVVGGGTENSPTSSPACLHADISAGEGSSAEETGVREKSDQQDQENDTSHTPGVSKKGASMDNETGEVLTEKQNRSVTEIPLDQLPAPNRSLSDKNEAQEHSDDQECGREDGLSVEGRKDADITEAILLEEEEEEKGESSTHLVVDNNDGISGNMNAEESPRALIESSPLDQIIEQKSGAYEHLSSEQDDKEEEERHRVLDADADSYSGDSISSHEENEKADAKTTVTFEHATENKGGENPEIQEEGECADSVDIVTQSHATASLGSKVENISFSDSTISLTIASSMYNVKKDDKTTHNAEELTSSNINNIESDNELKLSFPSSSADENKDMKERGGNVDDIEKTQKKEEGHHKVQDTALETGSLVSSKTSIVFGKRPWGTKESMEHTSKLMRPVGKQTESGNKDQHPRSYGGISSIGSETVEDLPPISKIRRQSISKVFRLPIVSNEVARTPIPLINTSTPVSQFSKTDNLAYKLQKSQDSLLLNSRGKVSAVLGSRVKTNEEEKKFSLEEILSCSKQRARCSFSKSLALSRSVVGSSTRSYVSLSPSLLKCDLLEATAPIDLQTVIDDNIALPMRVERVLGASPSSLYGVLKSHSRIKQVTLGEALSLLRSNIGMGKEGHFFILDNILENSGEEKHIKWDNNSWNYGEPRQGTENICRLTVDADIDPDDDLLLEGLVSNVLTLCHEDLFDKPVRKNFLLILMQITTSKRLIFTLFLFILFHLISLDKEMKGENMFDSFYSELLGIVGVENMEGFPDKEKLRLVFINLIKSSAQPGLSVRTAQNWAGISKKIEDSESLVVLDILEHMIKLSPESLMKEYEMRLGAEKQLILLHGTRTNDRVQKIVAETVASGLLLSVCLQDLYQTNIIPALVFLCSYIVSAKSVDPLASLCSSRNLCGGIDRGSLVMAHRGMEYTTYFLNKMKNELSLTIPVTEIEKVLSERLLIDRDKEDKELLEIMTPPVIPSNEALKPIAEVINDIIVYSRSESEDDMEVALKDMLETGMFPRGQPETLQRLNVLLMEKVSLINVAVCSRPVEENDLIEFGSNINYENIKHLLSSHHMLSSIDIAQFHPDLPRITKLVANVLLKCFVCLVTIPSIYSPQYAYPSVIESFEKAGRINCGQSFLTDRLFPLNHTTEDVTLCKSILLTTAVCLYNYNGEDVKIPLLKEEFAELINIKSPIIELLLELAKM